MFANRKVNNMPTAKNMYIDWIKSSTTYDMLIRDWYCSVDTTSTFWAVHH
jgi:hypothetical protein